MYREVLLRLYQINHFAATKNLEGLTHADSLLAPPGGGNCLNWVLGHIVASRHGVLALLGGQPVWTPSQMEPYMRGAAALAPEKALPHDELVQAFNETQSRIEERLKAISEDDFAALVTAEHLGENLAFLHFHEGYHIGQIGLLRRLAGRAGAIQ